MRVSHIFIYLLIISLYSVPVSADLIIESNSTANITDKEAWSPALSPDGETIAYVAKDASWKQQIYTIKINGSDKKQLTNDSIKKWGIEWLTDEISFMSLNDAGLETIFIVSLDGSQRRKLLDETIRMGMEPIKRDRFWGAGSWNSVTKVILFTSKDSKANEKIFQVNIDGTGLKQVINDSSRQWNPQWSPDGNSFVYVSQDTRNLDQLFIANADGTGIRQITDDGFKKYELDWGKYGILFVSTESQIASSEKIFIIDPDGKGKRRLIEDGDFNQKNPWWSMDGTRILYENIDMKGNQLIKVLNLKKTVIEPTITQTVVQTAVKTVQPTPIYTEQTPVTRKTESTSSLSMVFGIIIVILVAIFCFSTHKKV
jgi:Tol biopolymer transport system component